MNQQLSMNKQHKHGKANYSLEKFGLTKANLEETMKDYKRAFNV